MSDERAYPIVPVDPSPIASSSSIAAIDGRLLSAIACVESGFRGSRFVARVLNGADYPVFCSVYGESSSGIETLPPYEFRVDASGTEDADIIVPRRLIRPVTRVIVSMRGARADYRIDARVPRWIPSWRARIAGIGVVALAAFLALNAGSVSVGNPPPTARTNSIVRIPYHVFGSGSATYEVQRNGSTIASGPLAFGDRELSFATGSAAGTLRVRVALAQLATTRFVTSGAMTVETPPPPPQIRAFSLSSTQAHSGDRIELTYRSDASQTSAEVLDERGRAIERIPLRAAGSAAMTAPAVDAPRTFRVRIVAERNGMRTSNEMQLAVAPVPTPPPEGPLAIDAPMLQADRFVSLVQPYAVGGTPLALQIVPQSVPFRIALQTQDGRTVATEEIASGQREASIAVPSVASDSVFVLVVTIASGDSEQSLLMPVQVRAR